MSTLKVTNLQNENGIGPAMSINVGGGVTFAGITTFHSAIDFKAPLSSDGVTVATGATISGSTNTIVASTNGEERLRIASDGNIGIGTDEPVSGKLHVLGGNIRISGTTENILKIRHETAGADSNISQTDDGSLRYRYGTDERLRITSGGDVGIGLTDPSARLHVIGEIKVGQSGEYTVDDSRVQHNVRITSPQFTGRGSDAYVDIKGDSGATSFVRVLDSGNVGIGSTQPTVPLDVAGAAEFAGTLKQVDATNGTGLELITSVNNWSIQATQEPGSNVRKGLYLRATATDGTQQDGIYINATTSGSIANIEVPGSASFDGNISFADGQGIDFSSNSTAGTGTTTSSVLNDYEEGTFTPKFRINNSETDVTYLQNKGAYIKVGNKVTVWGRLSLTNNGSSTGRASIGDLPFTVADVVATTAIDGGGNMTYQNNLSGIYGPIVLAAINNGTYAEFYGATTTNGNMATDITQSNINNDFDCRFVLSYQAA